MIPKQLIVSAKELAAQQRRAGFTTEQRAVRRAELRVKTGCLKRAATGAHASRIFAKGE